jgi:hypothetical protein
MLDLNAEWLEADGLGGFSSGTVSGDPDAALSRIASRPLPHRPAGWICEWLRRLVQTDEESFLSLSATILISSTWMAPRG